MTETPRHARRASRLIRYGIPGAFIVCLLASAVLLSGSTLLITGVIA